MKPEKKRRNIVARIMGAENKTEAILAEAVRAGVHPRTVERWVENAQAAVPDAGQNAVSENTVPTTKPAENPVLDKLLQGEGGAGTVPVGPPNQTEIHQAAVDAENFCVEAYAGVRATIGSMLVSVRYSPPLDATSPEVAKLLKIGVAAELALRANAPRLYPILVKYSSGWTPLILAVGADAFGMIVGLEALAKSKGWVPTKRKEAERAATVEVPSPKTFGEQIHAAQVKTESTSAPAGPGADTVVNAPIPTAEQIEQYNAVARAMGVSQVPVPVN